MFVFEVISNPDRPVEEIRLTVGALIQGAPWDPGSGNNLEEPLLELPHVTLIRYWRTQQLNLDSVHYVALYATSK